MFARPLPHRLLSLHSASASCFCSLVLSAALHPKYRWLERSAAAPLRAREREPVGGGEEPRGAPVAGPSRRWTCAEKHKNRMRKEKQWEWWVFFVVVNPMKHMRLISASGSVTQEFQPPNVFFFFFFCFYSQVILAVGGIPHSENPFQKICILAPGGAVVPVL